MGSTTVEAAPPRNYAQETKDTLATQIQLAPSLYESESQYQPLYNQLQLGMTDQALFGTPEQRGLLDIYSQLNPQLSAMSAASNTAQRTADIADVEALGARASNAFLNANPGLRSALDRAESMSGPQANPAMDQLNQRVLGQQPSRISQLLEGGVVNGLSADGSLTSAEMRAAEQQVRAAYAARGMAMSPQAISAEAQNRLVSQRQRQLENLQMAQSVNSQLIGERQMGINNLGQLAQLNQANTAADRSWQAQLVGLRQATASDPFQAILGRPSVAFQQAQGYGGMGMASTQAAGPALFNPESSYANNIYGGNQQAENAARAATAANKSAITGALIGAAGTVGGASILKCWVAREVYGVSNPKWLVFRHWLETSAPVWFHDLYVKHGEKFAAWISNKPIIKRAIRRWMDGRIATLAH